jgi:hypothetical protein
MSRLYGTLKGARGEATRCAHKSLTTNAAGWRGTIRVYIEAQADGTDTFRVELAPWQNSGGATRVLAEGILDASRVK